MIGVTISRAPRAGGVDSFCGVVWFAVWLANQIKIRAPTVTQRCFSKRYIWRTRSERFVLLLYAIEVKVDQEAVGEGGAAGFGATRGVTGVARLNGLVEDAEIAAARAPVGEVGEPAPGVDVGGLVGVGPAQPSRGAEGAPAAAPAAEAKAGPAALAPIRLRAEPAAGVALERRGDAAVEVGEMAVRVRGPVAAMGAALGPTRR